MADPFGKEVDRIGSDRRKSDTREQIINNIVGTFNEMAGMSLTVPQACRLFGIADRDRCERIVQDAVARGLLAITAEGLLIRGGGATGSPSDTQRSPQRFE